MAEAVEQLVQVYEALEKKNEVVRWTREREAIEARVKKTKEQEMASAAADRAIAAGRTQEAVAHLVTVSIGKPDDTPLFQKVAALQSWFGQDKELGETCRRGLAFAKNTTVPETADRVAKACCMIPSTDKAQLEAALTLARKAVQLKKVGESQPWFQVSLGMSAFRNGQLAEADAALNTAAREGAADPRISGMAAFYRAMSLFRLGREDEARMVATEAAAKMKPFPADEKNPLAGNARVDDLILWMAYKEAKALIKFEPAPPAQAPPVGK